MVSILSLGHQSLTGVFPRNADDPVTSGPLELVWCPTSGLLQLGHSYSQTEMYGDNYGYRSGLNQSMIEHLSDKIRFLERLVQPKAGDTVLDIGSNDCTSLKAYQTNGIIRYGIDPTGLKFSEFYPPEIKLIPEFFSDSTFKAVSKAQAKIITSIAMFYDLDSPLEFAKQICNVLAKDGVWHFEQSYMPSMLRSTSYDTICHEHLEYYSLAVIKNIIEAADLKIIDAVTNGVNGGSIAVTATHSTCKDYGKNDAVINWLLEQEELMGLGSTRPYREFEDRVFRHRKDLKRLIDSLNGDGKKVWGYGASTKGNVLLQFCDFTPNDITGIAEVNKEKFGCVTPGSHIPIVSEEEARAAAPDYFLVLPWHFKNGILKREREFLKSGGKMIFPFPEIEII